MAGVFIRQVFAGKYVPQMSAAPGARYLSAHAIGIQTFLYCALHLVIKTRPTATGFKFIFGIIKRSPTLAAYVNPACRGVYILSGKWRFCAFVDYYSFFVFRQCIHRIELMAILSQLILYFTSSVYYDNEFDQFCKRIFWKAILESSLVLPANNLGEPSLRVLAFL